MSNGQVWTHVGNAGDDEKVVVRFKVSLAGEVAQRRDSALMEYFRGMQKRFKGEPFTIDPQSLSELWDAAYLAGHEDGERMQRLREQEPTALANSGIKEKQQTSRKKRSSS